MTPYNVRRVQLVVENIPPELRALPQWVAWDAAPAESADQKPRKFPVNPHTGRKGRANDSVTWGTLERALACCRARELSGIGFVFSAKDDYCGVDLDHCRDSDTGAIEPWAQQIIDELNTYTEISVSGTGVHCIARGTLPEKGRKKGNVEMYCADRFFCFTGAVAGARATIEERVSQLWSVHARWIAADAPHGRSQSTSSTHTRLLRRAEKYVSNVSGVEAGGRNDAAFRLAGNIAAFTDKKRHRLSESEILELLRSWNTQCTPPLSDVELQDCVASALRNGTPRDDKLSTDVDDDPRPEIDILAGEMPVAAEQAERELNKTGEIYQRLGHVVRLHRLEQRRDGKVIVDAGAVILQEVKEYTLLDRMARVARFFTFDGRGERSRCHPPLNLARAVLAHSGAWPFAFLDSVVEAPQLFRDGRVLERPGHDPESGLFFDPHGTCFPPVPRAPTKDDAKCALDELKELLAGFAFVRDCDRSAGLALILSGIGRSAYQLGPAIGASAPIQQCGKTTLLSLPSLITTGRRPVVVDPGGSPDECDKRMTSILAEGHRHICFDNLKSGREIDAPAISKMLTELIYTGRLLGTNRMGSFPTDGLLCTYSGVNIYPQGDTVSRTILIQLDPGLERPSEVRWSTADPREVVLDRRGRLVAAGLTVLRAYKVAGAPSQLLSFCRFKEWDLLIRHALVWLGEVDPLEGMRDLEDRDPETEVLADLMRTWWASFGPAATPLSEVLQRSKSTRELRTALCAVAVGPAGDPESRRLSHYLRGVVMRRIGARRFVQDGTSGNAVRWALREVGVSGVSGVSAGHQHASAIAEARAQACADVGTANSGNSTNSAGADCASADASPSGHVDDRRRSPCRDCEGRKLWRRCGLRGSDSWRCEFCYPPDVDDVERIDVDERDENLSHDTLPYGK